MKSEKIILNYKYLKV